MERNKLKFKQHLVKQVDAEKGTVTAPIAVLTLDRDSEVVEPKSFEKRFDTFLDNPVVLWAHMWKEPAIGNMVDYELSDETLLATTKFADYEFAKTIESLYMGSFLRAFSVGFIPWEVTKDKRFENQKGDTIIDAELLEYSTVNIPSNREALVKVYGEIKSHIDSKFLPFVDALIEQPIFKSCGHKALYNWDGSLFDDCPICKTEDKKVIPYKDLGGAREEEEWDGQKEITAADVDTLKLICAWYDADNPNVKASYKLPHHKAMGDNVAVWNGVKAAMGALLGARGGVDIPESEREGVYNHLAKHYAHWEKEPPEFKEYADESLVESPDVSLKRRSVKGHFTITGDTDVTNEHCHIYEVLVSKTGAVAGRTWDTFNVEEGEWEWENNHIHIITSLKRCEEEEGHTHSMGISLDAMAVLTEREEEMAQESDSEQKDIPFAILEDEEIWSRILELHW